MYSLAIESSTKTLSVALFRDNKLLQEIIEQPDGKKTHSEKLLPFIDSLLRTHHISLDHINYFAVAVGPGAYTSLRVGLATVMGLCQTSNIPVVPVSTLYAMAWGAKKKGELIVPLLKAGRGYVYAAGYCYIEGKLKEEIAENICDPEKLLLTLSGHPELVEGWNVLFVGPGCELLPKDHSFKSNPSFIPRASFVGEVAVIQKIPSIPSTTLKACYLQGPVG